MAAHCGKRDAALRGTRVHPRESRQPVQATTDARYGSDQSVGSDRSFDRPWRPHAWLSPALECSAKWTIFSTMRNGFAETQKAFSGLTVLVALGFSPVALAAEVDTARLPSAVTRTVDFARDVQPLLDAKCLDCHSATKQKSGFRLDSREAALRGGENYSPAILPGKSGESPFIHLVAGLVPDMRMPYKAPPLTADEVGILRAWIDQGVAWTPAVAPRETHWSFRPIVRSDPPASSPDAAAPQNAIDALVRAQLAEQHLSPSPEAGRRTLIRRVYFDLIGLPPTPEAVTAFVTDPDPAAYERLVDQLLASPRYGERWARHWLDIVRFAETHGFEMNQPRSNAWRYRDYVIRAFNEDKPYDQFVQEQLAGDVLGADEATGMLVAGAWDQVKSPDPVLTANQRADELHDMVSTVSSTFLGLTVGCARCHDHKFDPIPQTDYYALKAVLAGVQHGERKIAGESSAAEREAAEKRQRLSAVERALEAYEPLARTGPIDTNALRAPVNARLNTERFLPVAAQRLRFTIRATTAAEPCLDELEVFTPGPLPRNVALASLGVKSRASGVFPNSELHRLEHLNDGQYGNSRSWISSESGRGWVELEFPQPVTVDTVRWSRDRAQKFSDRLPVDYLVELGDQAGDWHLVASSADRQPFVPGGPSQPFSPPPNLDAAARERFNQLAAERLSLDQRLAELSNLPMAYAGTFDAEPQPTHRLHRGDPTQPREVISPGALRAIPVPLQIPAAADEAPSAPTCAATNGSRCGSSEQCTRARLTADQQRRLALARWLVAPANPFPARVIVNRLWQYHFGEGLVTTPSDLGANGAKPSHPALLDWLAAELVSPQSNHDAFSRPWSIKHLQRLMVLSATYRQSSDARPEGLERDAGTRFWWRFPPRRLEAEAIRDSILAVSGKLDLRMGGPGFSFFAPNDNYVRVYSAKSIYTPEDWRRMVYGTVVRQRPDTVFGSFDCPDGGQIAPKRGRSLTPLQALNLLNSPFIMQQAGFFAARLRCEARDDVPAQVRRAFALAFQREPDAAEMEASARCAQEQGLSLFCRALLNANEFVYLF